MRLSAERGRDSYGFGDVHLLQKHVGSAQDVENLNYPLSDMIVGNCRAEPTTEYVKDKTFNDIQPFTNGEWVVSHNGIIANDKELIKTYNLEDIETKIDSGILPSLFSKIGFVEGIKSLVGSYAIAAINGETLYLACNYKPIFIKRKRDAVYFASLEKYLRASWTDNIVQMEPYSIMTIQLDPNRIAPMIIMSSLTHNKGERVLVICSGGLDSVITASQYIKDGKKVTLLYFSYGCKAEQKEIKAVHDVGSYFKIDTIVVDIRSAFKKNIFSSLTDDVPINHIGDGMSGAEFAHEWVPARNMVFYSLALAIAESNGFDIIALGNNLEESGAYPDNEMIFTELYSKVVPYAINVGKNIKIEQPVGNLMKHEIVKLGKKIDAPMHLTWSCYESGEKHCGICGPCYMRRKAFGMNGFDEVIEYEEQEQIND
jgi:7-cyano-7-deazaguanine synthase